MRLILGLLSSLLMLAVQTAACRAQDDFYQGKTLRIVISAGTSASNGTSHGPPRNKASPRSR